MTKNGYLSITGAGVVTPAGKDIEALYNRYTDKKEIVCGKAETEELEKYISKKQIRRMCRFTALGLLAVYKCLSFGPLDNKPHYSKMGIILATGYGPASAVFKYLDSLLDYGFEMPSPISFSTSVQNMPAANIAIALGLQCPVMTVCQLETSVYAAFKTAEIWLKTGIADDILLIGADETTKSLEICSEIASRGHRRSSRKSFTISEGAFCIRLTLDDGRKSLGKILRLENKISEQDWPEGFRSGAYNEALALLEYNAGIYGNIPIAQGFDILIGLECLKNGKKFVQCAASDSYGNIGNIILAK